MRAASRGIPGFDEPFRLPKSRSDATFVDTARTFIREGERTKEAFVRYRVPDDFTARLGKALEDFEVASRVHQAGRNTQTEARTGIDRAFTQAFAALQTLNTAMPNELANDPGKLAVWQQIRKLNYARRTRRVASVMPATPVDVPPAAPAPVVEVPKPPLEKAS